MNTIARQPDDRSPSAGVPAPDRKTLRYIDDRYRTMLADAVKTGRNFSKPEIADLRALGAGAAHTAFPLADVVDALVGSTERAWSDLPSVRDAPTAAAMLGSGATVFRLLRRACAAVADGYGQSQRQALAHAEVVRREFAADLLRGGTDPGRLAERAERFGVLLAADHVVAVARADRSFTVVDSVPRRIEESLAARFGLRNVLVAVRDGLLVCIVPSALRGGSGEFAHHLVAGLGAEERWQIGVGRAHSGSDGVLRSYEEARNALSFAERLGFTTPVLHAADLLVFPVLLRDKAAIVDLVGTVLGPLTAARAGPQSLLDSLTAFFACHGNISATARQLGITARAVGYRLDRVHKLTGYRPDEPTQRFTLEAAVLGARLLGWPDTPLDLPR